MIPFRSLAGIALAASLACALPPAAAQNATPAKPAAKAPAGEPAMTADALALQKALLAKFPDAEIRYVAKTPYFGLYEVLLDDRLVYTDAKARHVIVGSIYDTESKENVTEARQQKLTRIAWSDLPLNLALKKVKGTGERKMAIFSDADCPFCARLENELKAVDNVTIYTFLYPIDQLHPDAARKSAVIWCSADRNKAWDEYYASGKLPDNKPDCATPLAETQLLGRKLRVQATPTLVFADGSLVPGAIPAAQIEQQLKTADAEARKAGTARN